jgi:nucleoside-diphosphate-sugar epimerase
MDGWKIYFLVNHRSYEITTFVFPDLKVKYSVDTLGFSDTVNYNVDLSETIPVLGKKYDIILHAAEKAHSIPRNNDEIKAFYKVNCDGTKSFCKGLEDSGLSESFIFTSTVAVYGCEYGESITEDHPLNAETPYGKSKIQAEEYLSEWSDRNNIHLTILRPSLLAGKNPHGNMAQ